MLGRVLLLVTSLLLKPLVGNQQQPQRRKVSVVFTYNSSVDGADTEAAVPLQLYWLRPDGYEKPWGPPMLRHQREQRVSSYVGDVWLVKAASDPTSLLLHTLVLPNPDLGAWQLTADVATGVIISAPANSNSPEGGGVWAVEIDLGADYGFEFSPQKVAAERRVTMTRTDSPTENVPRGPIEASAYYGIDLSENAVVQQFSPPGLRPAEEGRLVIGSRIEAIDGVPIEHNTQRGEGGAPQRSAREQVHELLGRIQLPAGESVWTVTIPPSNADLRRASGPRLDNPYVPPRSRQVIQSHPAIPRGLGSWERWEADNPQYLGRVYSTDPIVRTYDGFFTAEQCAEIKLKAASTMRRGNVASTKGIRLQTNRLNDTFFVDKILGCVDYSSSSRNRVSIFDCLGRWQDDWRSHE